MSLGKRTPVANDPVFKLDSISNCDLSFPILICTCFTVFFLGKQSFSVLITQMDWQLFRCRPSTRILAPLLSFFHSQFFFEFVLVFILSPFCKSPILYMYLTKQMLTLSKLDMGAISGLGKYYKSLLIWI